MPLPRNALYGLGVNLHIAVWPGTNNNTKDITRFIAQESRSFVVSVSSLIRIKDFPKDTPHLEKIIIDVPQMIANGCSCIAGPDGEWILPPSVDTEELITCTIDFNCVPEERQNFDVTGHYSGPDVKRLTINRERQSAVDYKD